MTQLAWTKLAPLLTAAKTFCYKTFETKGERNSKVCKEDGDGTFETLICLKSIKACPRGNDSF